MRSRIARCAVVVGATAVVLAPQLTATVNAEPTGPSIPRPVQLSADQLPADLVSALRRDLDMSPEEYLERAAAAQQVSGFVAERRRSDPSGYAGAWLAADGTPTVTVTRPELAAGVAASGFRADVAPLGVAFREGAPGDRPGGTPPGVRFEPATATVSGTEPIGGDGYLTTTVPPAQATTYLTCSFGFTASDAVGRPLALSAGHCDPNRAATGTAGAAGVYAMDGGDLRASPRVGYFANSGIGETAGRLDYSVIALTPDAAAGTLGQPAVRGENNSVLTLTGTAVPVAGAIVCKSGWKSGYTCGEVLDIDETVDLEGTDATWSVRGFTHSACTLGGDSGGAIITGTLALGITSGSNIASAESCEKAEQAPFSLGVPVGNILGWLNGPPPQCAAGPRIAVRTESDPTATASAPVCGDARPDPSGGESSGSGSLGSLG